MFNNKIATMLFACATVLVSQAAVRAEQNDPDASDYKPAFLDLRTSSREKATQALDGAAEALFSHAAAQGYLDVTVSLAVPESKSPRNGAGLWKDEEIKKAQMRVLSDLNIKEGSPGEFAGKGVMDVRLFKNIPVIGFTVDENILRSLAENPLVESIRESTTEGPS